MPEQFSNKTELEVKDYWKKNNIPEKVRIKKGKNNYYFIDGPPYASGSLHLGTAMNRILKDLIIDTEECLAIQFLIPLVLIHTAYQ